LTINLSVRTEKAMTDVPYLGISARKIGNQVGDTLWTEMKKRNWPQPETGLCVVTFDELDTAVNAPPAPAKPSPLQVPSRPHVPRTAKDQRRAGRARRDDDSPHAAPRSETLADLWNERQRCHRRRPRHRRPWVHGGQCDRHCINGTDGISEFQKAKPTGFFASVLLTARKHGSDTIEMLYHWAREGKAPPADTRTTGELIDRSNYESVLKAQGITG